MDGELLIRVSILEDLPVNGADGDRKVIWVRIGKLGDVIWKSSLVQVAELVVNLLHKGCQRRQVIIRASLHTHTHTQREREREKDSGRESRV